MKKFWLTTSLFLAVAVVNAQETPVENQETAGDGTLAVVEPAGETNTNIVVEQQSLSDTKIGYTLTKDEQLYASPHALFEIKGVDELSGLQSILVSIDGGTYSPYKGPISFETEGAHTISYQFVDRVGNVSYSQIFEVYIDASAPRILEAIVSPMPYNASGNHYVGPNSSLSFKAFDDITGVAHISYKAEQSNEFVTYTAPVTFAELGYTNTAPAKVIYTATDMVSNVSAEKTAVYFVDATPPAVNVFTKAYEHNGVRYVSSKNPIFVEAFDNETKVSNILYSINEGEYTEYDPAIGIYLPGSGEFDVNVKALDIVGNESPVVVYSVVVDAVAPYGKAAYIAEADQTKTEENSELGSVEAPVSEAPVEQPVAEEGTLTETPVQEDEVMAAPAE